MLNFLHIITSVDLSGHSKHV